MRCFSIAARRAARATRSLPAVAYSLRRELYISTFEMSAVFTTSARPLRNSL